ncbi:MAG: TolC family protein [Puniceicoccales bacterium]|nr:TolC family protein [Puniceicoccales bacterium]
MAHFNLPKSTFVRLLAAALAATFSGCADNAETVNNVRKDTKDVRASLSVPRRWHNREGVPDSAPGHATGIMKIPQSAAKDRLTFETWWGRFNDPVLEQLIRTALQYSPDLRIALQRVEEVRARRNLSRADGLPKLYANLGAQQGYRRNHKSYTTDDGLNRVGHTTTASDLYTAGLQASWEIDLFGKYRSATAAATAEVFLTEENFRASQISLVAEVAIAYVELRAAEARLGIAQRTVATREQTLKLANLRKEAGTGDELEVRLTEVSLDTARAAVPVLQTEVVQTRNRIAILTGNTPGKYIDDLLARPESGKTGVEAVLASIPQAPSDVDMATPAKILSVRPDVAAAERSFESAAFLTKSAKTAYYPTLNLSGGISIEALKAGNLFSPDATVGSILAGLSQPIFDGFRIQQNIEIATIQQKQALISYESVVLNALGEIEDFLVDVKNSADRLAVQKGAAFRAADSSRLESLRYQTGNADILSVLDAQRTQLGYEEQAVIAAANQTVAQINLFKSLGGAWAPKASD